MRGENLRRERKGVSADRSARGNRYDTVSISRAVAEECGLCAAFVFEDVSRWIRSNESRGVNVIEGRAWMYDTAAQITADVGFFSVRTVNTALKTLVEKGYLVKGNFNREGYDRTLWYALGDRVSGGGEHIVQNLQNGLCKNCTMDSANFAEPIPTGNNVYNRNNKDNGGGRAREDAGNGENKGENGEYPQKPGRGGWPDAVAFVGWLAAYCNDRGASDRAFRMAKTTYEGMDERGRESIRSWRKYFAKIVMAVDTPDSVCRKMRKDGYGREPV